MDGSGRYALVTGASSGIGWHLSEELAARGYSIVAVSNQAPALQNLKDVLEESHGVVVHTLDCDLSERDSAETVYSFCRQKGLKVEVLVNNAGIMTYGEAFSIDKKLTENILQLHMNTPVLMCRLFGSRMMEVGKGYILNVSSISAVMPFPTISLYGPTKSFLRNYTRALRTELNRSGVSVTCLIPGATATALYQTDHLNLPRLLGLGIMKRAETVARAGILAMFRGRAEKVPGLLNKVILIVIPLIPNALIAYIYRKTKRRNK